MVVMGSYFGVGSSEEELDAEEDWLELSLVCELEEELSELWLLSLELEELEEELELEELFEELEEELEVVVEVEVDDSEESEDASEGLLEEGALQAARKRSSAGIRGRNGFMGIAPWM